MNDQLLGGKPTAQPTKKLEVFENPNQKRDFHIHMQIPEFTCLCPKTGQPDFAEIKILYVPNEKCIELKSLKQYINSYRNVGEFHEHVTNKILDDIILACKPKYAKVIGDFNIRGGIKTIVEAEYKKGSRKKKN